ncbi:MAG: mannose-1-phosphate guanylyltransferase [Halobacteriaceae archaeon]
MGVRLAACLLAGGTGTRLYPASTPDRPKQFCTLDGERTLLRRTADRVAFVGDVFAVAPDRYAERVREEVPEAEVLVEPASKDTGPALVYAAHRVREAVGDCVLVCLPSDHRVSGNLAGTLRRAAETAADTGGLVTVGVEPSRPATGYGYVEPATADPVAPVAAFREKPDAETARELVDTCYWNAGIFAWTPDALLREAADSPLAPLVDALGDGDPERGFREVEAVSVDRAVLERTDDAYVVPADFEWDDVGSWDAFRRLLEGENAVLEGTPHVAVDASDNVIASDGAHVSVCGVDDLVVAAFDDRVLVVPREEAQRVREVVDEL